ncbi:DUF2076 domain-containing protein [Bradyrhizobium sp. LHD-71]|uniref:DUF2076 domain-containing protein n=1 Tax=Bradyrhizobium sp. LHD-71 TaxID=3072141 RepID=UPI00280CF602|nr:DUF2076 domain-containing protein [Bradyrhizobium sp. LHD-71]MDQ8726794.1 DUF2076 domain-containing protein [Bradyrhizobium sp. LHD-71]
MNPQERQLLDELFDRLASLEGAPRDADAMAAISQGLTRAPHAIYPLVQTVLLQEEALKRAAARIEELEGGAPAQEQQGGFLDSMRDAIFGQQQNRGSVPNVRAGSADRPAWNTGAVLQNDPRNAPMPQGDPRMQQGGGPGGGSFLGTAAAAAAGVIGGSLLMNSIGGLMGGAKHGFGDTAAGKDSEGASPWSNDQSKGDLAREAGAGDVGRDDRNADAADSRQSSFDQASSEHHDDGGEDDYGSDDFDSGDGDFA